MPFDPGDDICPPWWPRWWKRGPWPPKPPKGFEKYEQLQLTLLIHELAGQLKDSSVSKEIRTATSLSLKRQTEVING
jgi:hypothetical protein